MIINRNQRLPRPALLTIATLGWALVLYLCWIMVGDSLARSQFALATLSGDITRINPFEDRYIAHPWQSLLHAGLGLVFAVLGPLQFASPIRERFRVVHRISGRILVPSSIGIGLLSITIGLTFPVWGHPSNRIVTMVAGAFMVYAFTRAFLHVRRRQFPLHREWMIRGFAIGISVAWFRLILNDVLLANGMDFDTAWNIVIWTSFPIVLMAAEAWIRLTRPRKAGARQTAPAPSTAA